MQPDPPSDRRYLEARVDVTDVVGDRPLRGARIACRLRPGATRQVTGVRAGLVVEDAATRADFGPDVALRDDAGREWVDLSLTVGRRNEPRIDGATTFQAPRFNAKNVATLAIYVAAPQGGALTAPLHVDSCVIDGSQDIRRTARRERTASAGRGDGRSVYVPSLPPVDAVDPSPAAPATDERRPAPDNPPETRAPGGRAGGGGGGGDPDPGPDPVASEPAVGGEVLLHDFEDADDVAASGALLSIDDSLAVHGRRSLRLAPDPAGEHTSVEARVTLAGRLPAGVLDGARISCRLRPHAQVTAAGAHAGLIVDDARGASDHGAQTVLRAGGDWAEVSLVVGERGESASDGGRVPQSDGFDSTALTTLRFRVEANEPLTTPVNLDHCTITVV
ncbi:hypothetical protein BH23ACT10_BH23ACT10_06020 [soil metagenome]